MKHVDGLQGKGLKELIESKKPKLEIEMESPEHEAEEEMGEMGEPKGISVEKVEVMKPKAGYDDKVKQAIDSMNGEASPMSDDAEMSDEEIEELLAKLMQK